MKKLLSLFAALALVIVPQSEGATASQVITGAGTNSLLSVGGVVYSLTLVDTSGSANPMAFFDAGGTDLTYTLAAYTNTTTYTTNITNIITTTTGVSQTNVTSGIYTERQNNAASTNNYATIVTLSVPASSTLTYSFGAGRSFANGILVTNTGNVTVTATYVPDL